jgi:serine protease inhibitor
MHPARKHYVCLLFGLVLTLAAASRTAAQQRSARTIHGTVTDSASGRLLPGVVIGISGSRSGAGALTDGNGVYTLGVPDSLASSSVTLEVLYIGYGRQLRQLSLGDRDSIESNFMLTPMAISLREIGVNDHVYSRREECKSGSWQDSDDVPFTAFSYRLFRTLAADSPDANLFISPVSTASVLDIALDAARGQTAKVMQGVLEPGSRGAPVLAHRTRALRESLLAQDCVELTIANSIWARADLPFDSAFVENARTVHNATAENLETENAAAAVNDWASRNTNGRIPHVVSDPVEEMFLLMNAVYFKGRWSIPFDTTLTEPVPFHTTLGGSVRVPMMTRRLTTRYLDGPDFSMARLAYDGGRFAMYVVLPKEGRPVDNVIDRLDAETMATFIAAMSSQDLRVRFPRLRLKAGYLFNDALERMGMGIAFDPRRSDLSGLVRPGFSRRLSISHVRQGVFLDISEEGTEAVAATTAGIVVTGVARPPIEFLVDRPYVIVIRDDATGAVLFIGRITNPRANET